MLQVTELVVDLVNDAFDEPDDDEMTAEEQGRDAARSALDKAKGL
jgi:hypothetical protein